MPLLISFTLAFWYYVESGDMFEKPLSQVSASILKPA